jgi:polyisoprenyl-teichoic acid--peptidoglycan teichoic acid transferase
MRRILLIATGTIVLLAAVVLGVGYWQASSIVAELHAGPKEAVVEAVTPELHRPPPHPVAAMPKEPSAQTILLIGSDRRWTGGNGARSDTIMLARIEPARRRIALLSIPRDLYVEIPGHGHDRINMAFHDGGERLLTHVVRQTFGVEIDHFVEVDFRGFKDLIADLGGVYVPVDQRYYNRNIGTVATNYANIDLQPGYQKLDAQQALAFARYRHDDNDFVRAARQQLLLGIVGHDALSGGWNPFHVRRLAIDVAKATTSDISSLSEIYSLARAIHDTPASRVVRFTVHARDLVLDGADYLAADRSQLRATLRAWLGTRSTPAVHSVRRPSRQRAVAAVQTGLVADGGRGAALLSSVRSGIRVCRPTALPPGFFWPAGAARSYTLAGHPATALSATAGSGDSILWMYTTWQDPPILAHPSGTLRHGGRTYLLYTAHGRLRQVAWRLGATEVWITNTLQSALGNARLLALAESCR